MPALALWCFRHRLAVIGLWVVLLLGLGAGHRAAGTAYSEEFGRPGTESTRALELLRRDRPAASGDTGTIVVHVDSGGVTDAAVRAKVATMLGRVAQLPGVTGVESMYGPTGATRISVDGRTAYADLRFAERSGPIDPDQVDRVVETARAIAGDGLRVELGGTAIQGVTRGPPLRAELIGLAAAAVVLVIALGSLLGPLLPLTVVLAGVGAGRLAVGLLSHRLGLSSFAPTLATLIGLGFGLAYALLVVTRYRAGRHDGLSPAAATVRSVDTCGRAVLRAGGAVVIALLGLLVLRLDLLDGLGLGAAVTLALTVLSVLTLLPALLGLGGDRLLVRRPERASADGGARRPGTDGSAARRGDLVGRRQVVLGVAVLVGVGLLSIPALSIRLGSSDAGSDPVDSTTRSAYDLLAAGFGPGSNSPLRMVSQLRGTADDAALDLLLAAVRGTDGVASVREVPAPAADRTRVALVVPTTAPQSEATAELIHRLRDEVVPGAVAGSTLRVYVGGTTAVHQDFAQVLTDRLPLLLGLLVLLGGLWLTVAFRSLLVPLIAAVMHLLSATASFGVVVAVFQWGWGTGLLGIGGPGPIETFVPVVMVAVLSGLSGTYQVVLVSRVHEEWLRTGDNDRAVRIGQAETGPVITAAALIMIFVFGAFAIDGDRVIAQFGVGLATAVAINAVLLRAGLVPALMQLFGRSNWWLPGGLDRMLPPLAVEVPTLTATVPAIPDQRVRSAPGAAADPGDRAPTTGRRE